MSYSRKTMLKQEEVFIENMGVHRCSLYMEPRPPEPLKTRIILLTNYIDRMVSNSSWSTEEKNHLIGVAEARRRKLQVIVEKQKPKGAISKEM